MERVRELDAVRGLAALAIVVYHAFPRWLPFGWVAVDLFFVLSGYLITSIILAHGGRRHFLRHFYVRRGLRIWPIYYLSLLALVVLGPVLPRPTQWAGLPYYLTYTQNVQRYWSGAPPEFSWYFKHTWSLAIEEQFYLVWPAVVLLAGRKRLPYVCLGLLGCSVLARGCGLDWWTLLGRGDGFALGGLLAWSPPGRAGSGARPWRWPVAAGAVGLGFVTAVGLLGGLPDHGPPRWPAATLLALNLAAFAAVGLVVRHAGRPCLRPLRGPVLAYLGKISYGLYLYHMIVLRIKMDLCEGMSRGRVFWVEALVLGLGFALAALSWHFVERPILALKARFDYRPGPAPALSSGSLVTRVDAAHPLPESLDPHRGVPREAEESVGGSLHAHQSPLAGQSSVINPPWPKS
jgi:peptidoglycan/LPS O-acetylase OafA/YrhL